MAEPGRAIRADEFATGVTDNRHLPLRSYPNTSLAPIVRRDIEDWPMRAVVDASSGLLPDYATEVGLPLVGQDEWKGWCAYRALTREPDAFTFIGGEDAASWLSYILTIQFSFEPSVSRSIASRLFEPFGTAAAHE